MRWAPCSRCSRRRRCLPRNWEVSLRDALQRTRLAPELHGVVTSASLGVAKPDAAIFAHALHLAEASPSEAIHIGDSPQLDVVGARNAGIQPILIGDAHHEGVPAIASLSQLPELIRPPPTGAAGKASR